MKGSINFSLANKEKINDIISDRISNNLVTEKEGYLLDATQGKILNNSIDTLNTNTSLVAGIFPFNRVIYKQIACAKKNTIIVDLSEYVDSKYLRFTVCFKCEHPNNSTFNFLSLNNFKMWFEKGTGGGQYATGFYYTRCTYSNMDSPNITIGSIKRNGAVSQYELTISKNDDNTLSITNNGLYGTYVGILIIPTEFEQLTNRIDEIKDTYLPLAGGTMNKGASIIVPYAVNDDRYIEITGDTIRNYLPSNTGYAGGLNWHDQSKNLLGSIGLFGSKGIPEYYFVGSYSDPFVKVDMEGNTTIKKNLTVNSTSYINGLTTLFVQKSDTTGYPSYLLAFDITDWFLNGSNSKRGFNGHVYSDRSGGYMNQEEVAIVIMDCGYSKATTIGSTLKLTTNNGNYRPCMIHDTVNNKYYLALKISGMDRRLIFHGKVSGTMSTTQIKATDGSGTLPTGYEFTFDPANCTIGMGISSSCSGNSASATKLATARTIRTNLGSTSTASFDGSANITPGVTGTLPVANGGTGKTTLGDSANALINGLSTGSDTPKDNDYYVSQSAGGGTTTTTFHRRPVSALWEYMKGKISSVLGLTASSYSGNSATTTKWATARNINGLSVDGTANRVNYGTCSTAAATAAKTVACSGFTLVTGAEITVKFTVTNTAASPTLNVNSTGAKAIYYRGAAITAGHLAANRTYTFRYNGTQYELVGDIDTNTTYKNETAMVDLGFKKDAKYTVHEFFDKLYDKGKIGNIALYFRYDNSCAAKVSDGTTTIDINGVSCLMFVRNKSETWAKHHAIISNKNKTYLLYAQHDGSTTPSAQGIIDLTSTVATSCTGNSTSANKLNTNAGGATQPVYFANGIPVKCTYTLGKSVPSNAVFTDTNTTYSAGTGLTLSSTTFSAKIANNLTTTTTGYALDARQGKVLSDKISNIGHYKSNGIINRTTVAANGAILSITVGAGSYLILMSVIGEGPAWYGENGSAITSITHNGYCLIPASTMAGYDRLCFRTFTASTTIGMFNCNGASKAYSVGTKLMAIRIN